jgi:hypothetical protein
MGGELILLTWYLGLFAFCFGLAVVIVGKVKLSMWSKTILKGTRARLFGLFCMIASVLYLFVFYWAWSKYDR